VVCRDTKPSIGQAQTKTSQQKRSVATLVLLVGTNPLPNWVVYRYLQAHPEVLPDDSDGGIEYTVLLHGTSTKQVAKRLQTRLGGIGACQLVELTAPRVPSVVRKEAKEKLARISPSTPFPSTPFHLNYTGGTKTMSVGSVPGSV
jgi:hypothetical protein